MALNRILVSFVLQLGIILPVTGASKVNIVAGETVVLLCPNGKTKTENPAKVIWKYEGKTIITYIRSQEKSFMANSSAKYRLVDEKKGNFSLWLPDGKGQYSCEVEGEPPLIYYVQRWHWKISQRGYVLQGETLQLEVMTSGKEYSASRIEWLSPYKAKVTGNEPRWMLENNNWKLQIKNLSIQEDHGIWECHVLPDGPRITYDVKVIGFLNALGDSDTRFAAVNNSVVLSCPLSISLTKEKSLENFLQSWDLMKDNKVLIKKDVKLANNTFPAKEISKVQFEDAGNYHCHFTFAKGHLNKSIHLIVMKGKKSGICMMFLNGTEF
ncbi:uncharacterized protein LOC121920593 [Sceloporus undulatus]|uniref:uncharacterized protein LOC121920593 n=1 Tax=Sceloporus undulatus TaxID=8520 RepID=UPI001C4BFB12|nr:uncharacterized protein LOC121920593 [Sceloporus undulatus]